MAHAFICISGLLLIKLLQLNQAKDGISLSLCIIKEELSSIQMGLEVTRPGKLFKIVSERRKLQEKMLCLLSLEYLTPE